MEYHTGADDRVGLVAHQQRRLRIDRQSRCESCLGCITARCLCLTNRKPAEDQCTVAAVWFPTALSLFLSFAQMANVSPCCLIWASAVYRHSHVCAGTGPHLRRDLR
jgi:hypothetical protein